MNFLLGSGRLAEVYAHEHGRKVGEVMTRNVETIGEDAELSEAVDRMIRRRIKRLPVLRGETLVGVIARSDLLKGLLAATPWATGPHSDAEIKAAIQAELDKLEWAPRASVRVEVQNGVVTFDGSIIDERLREGLKVIAENTPGCVGVHDHMAWIEPNSGFFMPPSEEEDDASALIERVLKRSYSAAAPWSHPRRQLGVCGSRQSVSRRSALPARGEKEGHRSGRVGANLGP